MSLLGTFFRIHNALGTAAYFQVVYNTPQVQVAQAGFAFTPVGGIHLFAITGQRGEVLREYINGFYYFQFGVVACSDPQLLSPIARFGIAYDPSARIATSPPSQQLAAGGFYEVMDTELRLVGTSAVSSPPPIVVPIIITAPPAIPVTHPSGPSVPPILPPSFPPTAPVSHAPPSQDQFNRIVGALYQFTTGLPLGAQGYTKVAPLQYNPINQSIHFSVQFHYEQATFIPNSPLAFDEYYQGDILLSDPLGSLRQTTFSVTTPVGLLTLDAATIEALAKAVAAILA